ncbi:hypothetical protein [Kordiimonas aquimaris]|uniref:hypothetical protein n=1 Tax=Kordiimonas aquimaris TaxID=707591 RepID=UPI0021CF7868|nr:hypothetical protein [Kordiimonas aquimaris]
MEFIKDTRSFFGAIALLIVGFLISLANAFYFYRDYFGDDIFMSHWWWEITLNFQILCLVLMWYAHSDRIMMASDVKKRMVIMQFCTEMIAVLALAALLILGAYVDWFRQPTIRPNIIAVHYVFSGTWLITTCLIFLARRFSNTGEKTLNITVQKLILKFWPAIILFALLGFGALTDYDFVYVLTPFFGYLQVALPYLRRSLRRVPHEPA